MSYRKRTFLRLASLALVGVMNSGLTAKADLLTIDARDSSHSMTIQAPTQTIGNRSVTPAATQYLLSGNVNGVHTDLYCVDLYHTISFGYSNVSFDSTKPTTINSLGEVKSVATLTNPNGDVTNAGKIAELLDVFYATYHTTDANYLDERLGLQAAIWTTEYATAHPGTAESGTVDLLYSGPGGDATASTTTSQTTWETFKALNQQLGDLTRPVSHEEWISPVIIAGTNAQGLVAHVVPEPSSFALAIFGVLGLRFVRPAVRRIATRKPE